MSLKMFDNVLSVLAARSCSLRSCHVCTSLGMFRFGVLDVFLMWDSQKCLTWDLGRGRQMFVVPIVRERQCSGLIGYLVPWCGLHKACLEGL